MTKIFERFSGPNATIRMRVGIEDGLLRLDLPPDPVTLEGGVPDKIYGRDGQRFELSIELSHGRPAKVSLVRLELGAERTIDALRA